MFGLAVKRMMPQIIVLMQGKTYLYMKVLVRVVRPMNTTCIITLCFTVRGTNIITTLAAYHSSGLY